LTRKVAVLSALAAVLAVPSGAQAQAPFEPLTERNARPFAEKLARQVAKKREVRSWYVSEALTVGRKRVVFQYSDRSRSEIFCTARLVVEQSSTRRRAFISAPRCKPIPEEALAIEKATSAALRAAAGQGADVARSIRATEKDVARCEGLVVPRSRHEEAGLLYRSGEVLAQVSPLLVHFDAFATRLQEIQPEDPGLVSGVVWWRRLVNSLQDLPELTARPCTALLEWSRTDYSAETAPVDFEQLAALLRAIRTAERGVGRAADHLGDLGVSPRVLPGFTPEGLLVAALLES
jgi:hypothetical protein